MLSCCCLEAATRFGRALHTGTVKVRMIIEYNGQHIIMLVLFNLTLAERRHGDPIGMGSFQGEVEKSSALLGALVAHSDL